MRLPRIVAGFLLGAMACDRGQTSGECHAADPAIARRYALLRHAGGETHFQRVGSEAGELVVLVPVATLLPTVFEPLVPRLVEAGFQVLRYDLPGRGHSSWLGRPQGLGS